MNKFTETALWFDLMGLIHEGPPWGQPQTAYVRTTACGTQMRNVHHAIGHTHPTCMQCAAGIKR